MTSQRPTEVFDTGLQHERTSLAWERTAISTMVAGILLARYAATDTYWTIAFAGLAQTAFGGAVLVWAGWHYDDLHGPLRAGDPVVHPVAATVVGIATVFFAAISLVLTVLITVLG